VPKINPQIIEAESNGLLGLAITPSMGQDTLAISLGLPGVIPLRVARAMQLRIKPGRKAYIESLT
jgi:hypothetical protein